MTVLRSTGPVGSFQEWEEFTVCMVLIRCKHGRIFTAFFSHKGTNPSQDGVCRRVNEKDASVLHSHAADLMWPLNRIQLHGEEAFVRVVTLSDVGGWSKLLIWRQLKAFWHCSALALPLSKDDATPSLQENYNLCVYSILEEKNPPDYRASLIKPRLLEYM